MLFFCQSLCVSSPYFRGASPSGVAFGGHTIPIGVFIMSSRCRLSKGLKQQVDELTTCLQEAKHQLDGDVEVKRDEAQQ